MSALAGAIADPGQYNEDLNPGWTDYTPVWSSDGTLPTLGSNGTLTGRYRRRDDADLIVVKFLLTRGSASTNGTGSYFFSVPEAHDDDIGTAVGSWYMTSGGQHYSGTLRMQTATTVLPVRDVGTLLSGTPVTLASGDTISGQAIYRPL